VWKHFAGATRDMEGHKASESVIPPYIRKDFAPASVVADLWDKRRINNPQASHVRFNKMSHFAQHP